MATKAKSETTKQVLIGPRSKKQEMYINHTADVVVFGGGAG